ncbi:helicase-exonuclease AddAB subunit AddA [Companilactobacillus ginsenosidimutans]|uniref:ATP-dependent helicase/nuclease subunit A n=1 Tax=Companilactobacillus ginsenosidimutans TaxID=1007676 RepID=A0A0H4QE06_9LACO|nr:helicase-exonuclease AddAB subunit AddA [Companilactobacillus ginsenosidimutans]AKP66589.1 ATP-dependent nuclease subunit A [Companilactobacillus ginsenosidimutans]
MPEWTENQKKAIFHHGHDILVSAAAGSGKTTILIERIIELLKNNENVDNLLVATFTDAAAKEMKDRLVTRIKELVASDELDPDQKQHMQSQIYKVAVANISTLHAFCLSVIKNYYYVINLDPNFRLLSDDTETSMLKEQAFDAVRGEYYAKADVDFLNLTDNFSNDKNDDGLEDTIFRLYDFAITNEDTDGWLDRLVDSYDFGASITDSRFFVESVKPQVINDFKNIANEMESLKEIAENDTLSKNYVTVLNNAIVSIGEIIDEISINESFDQIRETIGNFSYDRVKPLSKVDKESAGDDNSIVETVKKQKTDLKKQIEDIYNSYFVQDEEQTLDAIKRSKKVIEKLVEVQHAFIKEFNKIKTNNHTLDFNDLEHKAVQILSTEVDGKKIALEFYQNRFHEIMIDEYQDVNAMQENIIQLLSNDENHIFMVGDIKQSIYGFRQAAPYIFTGKYQKFQKDDNPDELIQLSKNFRSSVGVDDFVNSIFERIFDENIGDINYDKSVQLIPGTNFPEDIDSRNEMYILSGDSEEDADKDTSKPQLETANVDKRVNKIGFVAEKIQKLIDSNFQIYDAKKGITRSLKYSDIAILMRNKNSNTDLISYFSKAEIPVMVTDAQNYFQTTELQIMMAMLNIIDNPRQDIPLVAVLRSPIVGLNEEELAEIKIVGNSTDYYTAMLQYVASEGTKDDISKKIISFLERIEGYRDFSNKNSLVKLIWKIYQDTGILEYVAGMPGGKQRAANLHALYQRANTYEKNNFMGLHKFIDFIKRMQDMDRDLSQPNSIETTDDSVKVMTIHASKGLEFPIVFLVNTDDEFNKKDYTAETLYDVKSGIGITILDQITRANARTMQRALISDRKQVSSVSEEMRLLYVALTRAKQKLILVGFNKEPEKMLSNWEHVHKNQKGVITEGARLAAKSYQNLIGMSIIPENDTKNDIELKHFSNETSQFNLNIVNQSSFTPETRGVSTNQGESIPASDIFKKSVNNILDFKYGFEDLTKTTAYQSVSEIKGLFSDPDDNEMARADVLNPSGKYTAQTFGKPRFLAQNKKVNATDVGSATHLVLQKISIDKQPQDSDFKNLIEKLVKDNVVDSEVAKKIDINSLVKFYESDLGHKIIENKDSVSREYPFSVLMNADNLFNSSKDIQSTDDKILVHGIIDGVIELADKIIIFDYKTDNVNSDNIEEKIENYSGQLNLYAKAISVIKNQPNVGKYLYFLKINQMKELKKKD